MAECVFLHVLVVAAGTANDARGVSPATRAVRRGNRRLTRNESRYHSGKCFSHYCFVHFIKLLYETGAPVLGAKRSG